MFEELNQEKNIYKMADEPILGDKPVKVYIKINHNNEITNISSEVFIKDYTDWILIDEGVGNDYAFAEYRYLPDTVINENGVYNFVYENNAIRKKTDEEIKMRGSNIKRISELKRLLSETDYKAIKYAEGEISEEEYLPIKEQRRSWRQEINSIEGNMLS